MERVVDFFQYDNLIETIEQLAQYGPFAGILLAMVEAFFPPLPLSLFVTVNVVAYGFLRGYLYSWIGTFIGSSLVFLLIRRYGHKWANRYIGHHEEGRFAHLLIWVREKGFMPIFVMLTFPFTPSIVVCALAGVANVKTYDYLLALFFGKMVMVMSLSFIGYNVKSFVEQPIKSVVFILITLSISVVAKQLLKFHENKLKRKQIQKAIEKP